MGGTGDHFSTKSSRTTPTTSSTAPKITSATFAFLINELNLNPRPSTLELLEAI